MPNLIYDKYHLTNHVLRPEVHSVLDVGCRNAILKSYLRSDIIYSGLDLIPGPGVDYIANIEVGLPFANNAFDAVIALDLLEHVDNIWFAFDELIRVARHQVVVVLPNAYHWLLRLRYLRGKEMGKYILSSEPILDRHRWLLSYRTATCFVKERGERAGWSVTETILYGGRRTLPFDVMLAWVSKNLAVWAVMYVLEPNDTRTETNKD